MKYIRYYAIGHSYLRHGPFVGWQTDGFWGMAASAPENDYFHKFAKMIEDGFGAKVEAVAENHADFERICRADATKENYITSKNYAHIAEVLQNFKPNVISVLIGENIVCKNEASLDLFFDTLYEMLNKYKRNDAAVICAGASSITSCIKPVAEKYGFIVCDCSVIHLNENGKRPYYAFEDYPEYDEKAKMGGVEFRTHPGDKGHEKIASIFYENAKDKIAQIPDGEFLEEYEFKKYVKNNKVEKFTIKTEPEFYVQFGGFNIKQNKDSVTLSSAPGTGVSISAYPVIIGPEYKKFYTEISVSDAKDIKLLLNLSTKLGTHEIYKDIKSSEMTRYEFDISQISETITRFELKPLVENCFITIKEIGFIK